MSIRGRIRRALNRPTGWWSSPYGHSKHTCTVPGMPPHVPAGIIYRCHCGNEWTWRPATAATVKEAAS
jgi:hypothetical protein